MGVLTDGPAPVRGRGGDGGKFVAIYRAMDDDDKAIVRKWADDPHMPVSEIWRRLCGYGFDIGRSSVERGMAVLRAAAWEC